MDWPTPGRLASKNKRKKRLSFRNSPADTAQAEKLEMHFGMLGGALLTSNRETHQMEWTFALEPQKEILKQTSSVHRLSKPTRESWDDASPPPSGVVENQIKWFKSHHPELDFPSDLLEKELGDSITDMGRGNLEPLLGNRLRAVKFFDGRNEKGKEKDENGDGNDRGNEKGSERGPSCYALYAAGAIGNEFHSVKFDQETHSVTRDVKKVMMQTEIYQIESSLDARQASCMVACRSLATLGLFRLSEHDDSPDDPGIVKLWEMRWNSICEEPKAIGTDISLSPFEVGVGLVISDKGSLHQISTVPHGASMKHIIKQRPLALDECTEDNRFWRVKWGATEGEAFVAGDKVLTNVDLRSNEVASLFHIPSNSRAMEDITSFDFVDPDTICVATTNRVSWFDKRFPKEPIISYEHGRQYDRTISVNTIHVGNKPKTLLSSYLHPVISVYDVRRSARLRNEKSERLHMYGTPSYLQGTFTSLVHTTPRAGIAYVPRGGSGLDADLAVDLLELSVHGELVVRTLDVAPVSEDSTTKVSFQDNYQGPQLKPVADRETRHVNLGSFYRELYASELGSEQTADAERINNILEKMPLVWQSPVPAPLTMCDIVFYADKEHNGVTRSNFLAGLPLDYDSYDLKCSDHLSQDVRKGAGWTYSLAQLIRKLNPETASLLQAGPSQDDSRSLEFLSKYCPLHRIAQSPSKEAKAKSMAEFTRLGGRETAACKELALDLALSESIYSLLKPSTPCANPKSEPQDTTDALLLATQAMSLHSNEPPDPEFGYLKPRFLNVPSGQSPDGGEFMEDVIPSPQEQTKTFKFPLPTRLLLSEWQLGTPVDSYTFIDPYDLKGQNWRHYSQERQSSIVSDVKPGLIRPAIDLFSHLPPVALASSNYRRPEVPPVIASSQPPLGNDTSLRNRWGSAFPHAQSQSSDMEWSAMPSTQPMPGRYGGRPSLPLPAQKPKRLGGF